MSDERFTGYVSDESFGPGTDLVISMLACMLVLMTLDSYLEGVTRITSRPELPPVPICSECPSCPEGEMIWVIRDRDGEASLFGNNRAVLTQEVQDLLREQVDKFREALEQGRYRLLQVVGHASADTVRGPARERERANFMLSFDRALAVADFLSYQGIPYECLAVTAWGRSHSDILADWLREGGSLIDWDERGQYGNRLTKESLMLERRVEIWGLEETQAGGRPSACPLSDQS